MIFTVKLHVSKSEERKLPMIARHLRALATEIEGHGTTGFFQNIYDEQDEIIGQFALKPNSYYDPVAEEE